MIPRILPILFLLTIPVVTLGKETDRPRYIFKVDLPDSIKGIQMQIETKEIRIFNQGHAVKAYCLCADITNQNDKPEKFLIRYQCRGKQKVKEIEIGKNQQKMILIDKLIIWEEYLVDLKEFYSQVLLEYKK